MSANTESTAALRYVTQNGEADPARPMTDDISAAIAEYDGSCASEDAIWSAYMDAYSA
tara:strand:- start:2093 stop:2266 length:174 start_codon:yes stop_codon:yes gene_type:complete